MSFCPFIIFHNPKHQQRRVRSKETRVSSWTHTKAQSEAILTVEKSVGASTEGTTCHPVFPMSRVSDRNTGVKTQQHSVPPIKVGTGLGEPPQTPKWCLLVQTPSGCWRFSQLWRVYTDHTVERRRSLCTRPPELGEVNLLTGYKLYPQPFLQNCVWPAVREQLEPWHTTATLASRSGLTVYYHISLCGYIRNPFLWSFWWAEFPKKYPGTTFFGRAEMHAAYELGRCHFVGE